MPPRRRMGPQDSESSQSILDAAERVLRAKGYSAITSQKVAEEAGVKRQLIFYYFQNIDEMILVAFKRSMSRLMEKLEEAKTSDRPVHEIWSNFNNAFDARLVFEYTALANHNENIRNEITKFVEKSRKLQISIISKAYLDKNIDPKDAIPPEAVAFLISAITLSLTREEGTGITLSHKAIKDLVARFLSQFE